MKVESTEIKIGYIRTIMQKHQKTVEGQLIMKNVAVMLMSNTSTHSNSQQEVHNPMVFIINKVTRKTIQAFRIAADTIEDLNEMKKHMCFDTYDLPEGEGNRMHGAYFIGVVEDIKKENEQLRTVVL